ncbi:hypothetical protein [Mucilaginibacter sp. L3T2-6]|uniref:hypothetical protein n=1 Tax=Mucilaginibacter sp. L3T2-6 TaxID=3062491 RepID=UPI002676F8F6|nr:hypothetical protein [Mucilaginibacter sp. L3T2-6]MDO3641877.1 hypothetical protein [Mucilaginibacter sp. L3T2-6]MDV6214445.1 hypothetical protein [Mucilaginibacter sp. L3T2-6]
MLRAICPKCESYNIRKFSKAKYFIKMGVCMASVGFAYLAFTIIDELDAPANLGALLYIVLGIICAPVSIYYLLCALLKKRTSYECRNCGNSFDEGFEIKDFSLDGRLLLNKIRKRN